ncbi:MAG TPA: L,D-transpeptidase [Pseudolabrys sp.]|nr:L,D-transpeptidase [Pseudolabrys sp.]
MRLQFVPISFAAMLLAMTLPQAVRANVMIIIDKSAQKMTVTVNGEDRYIWPVSTGRTGYDTPSGEFQPFRMEKTHYSREWDDAPMPNSIFFTKEGHAIHGTYEVRNLGRPVSHGCVRLAPQNAAALYALVKDEGVFNTRVRLVGETPKSNDLVASRDRAPVMGDDPDDAPPRRAYQARGREMYRRPYFHYERRYYGRGLFFNPFGW